MQNSQPQQYEQTADIYPTRHYHEPVNPHEGHASTIISVIFGLFLFALLGVGIIQARQQIAQVSVIVVYIVFPIVLALALASLIYPVWHGYRMKQIKQQHAELDLQAKAEQMQRENEAHQVKMHLAQSRLLPDGTGNYPAIFNPVTYDVLTLPGGNFVQNVPHTIHIERNDHSTRPGQEQNLLTAVSTLHIPTFAELLAAGDVGPSQRDMLFCFEILQDEISKQVTGISPVRGEIGIQHTQFIVAGSQSGKTTYMAGMVAQAAFLKTLFYIVDPHKMHPEKSISSKVAAFKDFFILPPASTHEEIKRLLAHATRTRDDLIAGKPTPYQGYHIMVIVDEVPALMAWQRSPDKGLKQLYTALALFMQSIGTQTAKFGMTGLFSSQFATKEQLGEIDIRDACMSQFIMRLHPTQAQAMRILGSDIVKEIPKLEKGHGYLMLSDSTEARRVAAGNVTASDLTHAATLIEPSPLVAMARPHTTVVPIRDDVVVNGTTTSQGDHKEINNQIEPALQARLDEMGIPESYILLKVARVTQLLGKNKADIIRAVWNRSPGKNKEYYQAEAEFQICMEIIKSQVQQSPAESEA